MKKSLERLHDLIDARQLALFRMVFGSAMLYQTVHYFNTGLIESGLMAPKMLFKYEGFGWVQPFSAAGMNALLALLALSAACMFVGLFSRWAAGIFGLGFLFILLQDKALFNNHLYLFCLIGLLLACMPTSNAWSLDRSLFPKRFADPRVPRWTVHLLCAQFFIVYFYGGIAKLNPDWLMRQEPMRTALHEYVLAHPSAAFLEGGASLAFFNYGGLLFDLGIGFLLLWCRTRWAAIGLVLLFIITNHFLFEDIGVFPFVMLPATLLFFAPEEVAAFLDKRGWRVKSDQGRKRSQQDATEPGERWQRTRLLLAVYMAFQILFPLRWVLLSGNVDWTTIGQRFSWRMKTTTLGVDSMKFSLTNDAGEHAVLDASTYLNTTQLSVLPKDPRMVIAFARFALDDMHKRGIPAQHVLADIVVRFNGRSPQPLFLPDLDVAALRPESDPQEKWMPVLEEK